MHKIALVLAIAAVGEGLLALHLVSQLHEERHNAQALQARVTELERLTHRQAAGTPLAAAPPQPVAAPFTVVDPSAPAQTQQAAQLPQPDVSTEARAAEARAQMASSMERQRALLRDPEYREAMLAQQKTMIMRMNPDIAKDLELTPDLVDRLYTTLGEQYLRQMETQEYPWDPATTDPAQIQEKVQEAQRKTEEQMKANQAEIRKVLGDAKFREFEEYQAMTGARSEASRIRETLAIAGVPLEDSLTKPLAKALHEHQQKLMRDATSVTATAAFADGPFVARAGFITEGRGSIDDVEMQQAQLDSIAKYQRQQREALSRVLSPQQLKVIEEEQESALQIQRAQLRVLQTQPEMPGSN